MTVSINFTLEHPDVSERSVGRAHETAGKMALENFVKTRLKDRFNGRVQQELRWDDRKEKYEKRKAKTGARGVAHVLTRKTARTVLGGGARVIASSRPRGGKYSMRIVLRNLNDGYKRRPEVGRPDMRSEITRLTQSEQAEIATIYEREFARLIQEELNNPRVRKRG